MLQAVKKALRISHSYLDEEITSTIESARAELIRSGVSPSDANSSDNELINTAIKTYCKAIYANDTKMAEGYQKSFEYQCDNLRKSSL